MMYLIFVPNLDGLIDVFSFATWIFYGLSCSALIILRYTKKDAKRIFVTPLPIPIFMVLLSSYLVISPLVQNASPEHLIVLLILLMGVIVYYFFIHKKQSFKFMSMSF
jgi:L-type amino acid transporter 9